MIIRSDDETEVTLMAKNLIHTISNYKLSYKEFTIKITISVGIAKHNENDTFTSIIDRADKCLYKVKKNGKNNFILEK